MKLDQLCVYTSTLEVAEMAKVTLGLENAKWALDEVYGNVLVIDKHGKEHAGISRGILQFNYDTGMEYELLTYLDGPNWHDLHNIDQSPARVGHVGYHLEDGEEWPTHFGGSMVQEMITVTHSNQVAMEGDRRYHYRIYDTVMLLGYYSKVIRRLGRGTSFSMTGERNIA